MDLINKIDIQVTKAIMKSISITFNTEKNGLPDIQVCVDLMTANNKHISSVTLDTREYYGLKISRDYFPASIDADIVNIVRQLNPIIGRRINQIENILEV